MVKAVARAVKEGKAAKMEGENRKTKAAMVVRKVAKTVAEARKVERVATVEKTVTVTVAAKKTANDRRRPRG
jgi:hypothetical protein